MVERWSDAGTYRGTRTKGRRIATLWWSDKDGEGDVTVTNFFDELDAMEQLDALSDVIGMLKRQIEVCNNKFEEIMEKEFSRKLDRG